MIVCRVTKPFEVRFSSRIGSLMPGSTLSSILTSISSSNVADCGWISLAVMPCCEMNATALALCSRSSLYAVVRSGARASSEASHSIKSETMRFFAEPITLMVRFSGLTLML